MRVYMCVCVRESVCVGGREGARRFFCRPSPSEKKSAETGIVVKM